MKVGEKLGAFFMAQFMGLVVLFCLSWQVLLPTPVLAQAVKTENVEAELFSNMLEVEPGTSIWVALRQKINPGWHTYWINPGDSGQATEIDWDLPEGFQAGSIQWPKPEIIPVGPLLNYGFKDEVLLVSEIFVPDTLKPGENLKFRATARWLVCEEVCIPEEVDLKLNLRSARGKQLTDPIWDEKINSVLSGLPSKLPWEAAYSVEGQNLRVHVKAPDWLLAFKENRIKQLHFIPEKDGLVKYVSKQRIAYGTDGFSFYIPYGYRVADDGGIINEPSIPGLVLIEEVDASGDLIKNVFEISSAAAQEDLPVVPRVYSFVGQDEALMSSISLSTALLYALLGGLLLNLMPCVFPVLSMKALSFVEHVQEGGSGLKLSGIAYTLGVLVMFLALAGILLGLRAGGAQIGWGYQLQSPLFVASISYLMFVVGLNLLGVFEIGGRLMSVGAGAEQDGFWGSFGTGVLAVVVASPCTAPFMGVAMGFALFQSTPVSLAIFMGLGAGLALPYLVLSFIPSIGKALPKSGPWMVTFRRILAVPMFATTLWLLWVLSQQVSTNFLLLAVIGILLAGLSAGFYGAGQRLSGRRLFQGLSLITLVAALSLLTMISGRTLPRPIDTTALVTGPNFQAYSPERVEALRAEGQHVFVNFTAAWCITCLVNERVVLSSEEVRARFDEGDITYLKADWTNYDPVITQTLEKYGRAGVPLYVLYPARSAASEDEQVLPQLLTISGFLEEIDKL